MTDDEPTIESFYDGSAEFYADELTESPIRQHCRLPAVQALFPDLDGKRVLEAGCGTGADAGWLARRGATVVGIDVSAEMVRVAAERYGDVAEFERADLAEPLEFRTDSFDVVSCQLTLSHLESWGEILEEFRRVLVSGGTLVVSTDHPFRQFLLVRDGEHPGLEALGAVHDPDVAGPESPDYYATERYDLDYGTRITFYRRPLSAYLQAFLNAGFAIDDVVEPTLTAEFGAEHPEAAAEFRRRVPDFLCLRATGR